MPTELELQIIAPNGELRFETFDAARGVLTAGSDPSNSVVLAGLPDFAASLDCRSTQQGGPSSRTAAPAGAIQLTALANHVVRVAGRVLPAHGSASIEPWESFELGSYSIVVIGFAAAASPAAALATAATAGAAAGAAAAFPSGNGSQPPAAEPAAHPVAPLAPAAANHAAGSTAAAGAIAGAGQRPQLGPPIADENDDYLIVEIGERVQAVEVEQTAIWQATLINGSSLVSQMQVRVEGWIDESWVEVTPNVVNLNEGERQMVTITITPPRSPASTAGAHHLAIVVTSPTHPNRRARRGCTLTIAPFFEYKAGQLSPGQQTIGYTQTRAAYQFTLQNLGNGSGRFRVDASEQENACTLSFPDPSGDQLGQREIRLEALDSVAIPLVVTPIKRRVIGNGQRVYHLRINTTPLDGAQMATPLMGELKQKPLFGRWVLVVLALFVVAAVLLALRPRIDSVAYAYDTPSGEPVSKFSSAAGLSQRMVNQVRSMLSQNPGEVAQIESEVELSAGQSVTLTWGTAFADTLSLLRASDENSPVQIVQPEAVRRGSLTLAPQVGEVAPGQEAVRQFYLLRAENWMHNIPLIAPLGRIDWPISMDIVPAPVAQIQRFDVTSSTVVLGEPVTLHWDVTLKNGSESVALQAAPTTEAEAPPPVPVPPVGTLVLTPGANTVYRLIVNGTTWTGGTPAPTSQQQVQVLLPTATPVPTPLILAFDVAPSTVISGESITITYNISGATSSSLFVASLPEPVILITPEPGRKVIPVNVGGEIEVGVEAVKLPDGAADPADPRRALAQRRATVVAVTPTPTPTPTFTPTPTVTPQIPKVTALLSPGNEFILGSDVVQLLTWNVTGDMDYLRIISPDGQDFTYQTSQKTGSVPIPTDKTRTFLVTPFLGEKGQEPATVKLTVLIPTPTPEPTPVPPPPPTPEPTATATATPQISEFTVTAVEGTTGREADENGLPVYTVDAGSIVEVKWQVANAKTVTLVQTPLDGGTENTFADRLPVDTAVTAVDQRTRFVLKPNNNLCTAERACAVIVKMNQVIPASPPTGLVYTGGVTGQDPVTINWQYSSSEAERILGFRVYRGTIDLGNFARVADENVLNKQARTWSDTLTPSCGLAYFVVAVYRDPNKAGEDKTMESDAGAPSYYTMPCQ